MLFLLLLMSFSLHAGNLDESCVDRTSIEKESDLSGIAIQEGLKMLKEYSYRGSSHNGTCIFLNTLSALRSNNICPNSAAPYCFPPSLAFAITSQRTWPTLSTTTINEYTYLGTSGKMVITTTKESVHFRSVGTPKAMVKTCLNVFLDACTYYADPGVYQLFFRMHKGLYFHVRLLEIKSCGDKIYELVYATRSLPIKEFITQYELPLIQVTRAAMQEKLKTCRRELKGVQDITHQPKPLAPSPASPQSLKKLTKMIKHVSQECEQLCAFEKKLKALIWLESPEKQSTLKDTEK